MRLETDELVPVSAGIALKYIGGAFGVASSQIGIRSAGNEQIAIQSHGVSKFHGACGRRDRVCRDQLPDVRVYTKTAPKSLVAMRRETMATVSPLTATRAPSSS